ncbi:respiratory chain complex I subunit 1 family protein [Pseudobacteroides cellulosolvens]|uniref:Respiratory-chain NADH dehydrogenase subunit 1 n=1 Tax=Pseudobacteroides cellulosolvens ATCC 35603 = DSM 2933 TaxID=398512 RepID=A0A0L6JV24_9FIRM|nr:complex I subunit 1 family protein [Pseudobacteroides cellulosolvens]KNY29683.1 respiratory-chain NADH dehydrogenase subunit 1 [Pseudobacteroides cellulosolvens ATCC 35603 = DSM 2933]
MSDIFTLQNIIAIIVALIGAPIIGGILSGVDRIISARMQNRYGPPLLQPFYDFFKLMGKERITVNQTQMVYVLGHLFFSIVCIVMLVLKQDLLMIIFVLAFSSVSLIMGAMSVRSPYSKIGAQRELMQMMAYEPVLLLMVVGIYLTNKSFMISSILENEKPLLFNLPLVFAAFLYVLTIKLRKSPFDFSTSHHGHQELIKGLTTEFSGPQLAIIELAHWYDLVLLLALISLFFANPLWVGIIIALVCYFLEMLIDNISARVTWRFMLKLTGIVGVGAAMTNIIWLYLK